jgi:hypothetical protein
MRSETEQEMRAASVEPLSKDQRLQRANEEAPPAQRERAGGGSADVMSREHRPGNFKAPSEGFRTRLPLRKVEFRRRLQIRGERRIGNDAVQGGAV